MQKQSILVVMGLLVLQCTSLSGVSAHKIKHIPLNLAEANTQLDRALTPKAKAKFSTLRTGDLLNVRDLYLLDEWGIGEWGIPEGLEESPLVHYLDLLVNTKQETWGYQAWQARRYLVLLSYLRHVHQQPFDMAQEAHRLDWQGDSVAVAEAETRLRDQEADSLEGVYIPRNLRESVAELDRIVADSVKQRIRQLSARDELESLDPTLKEWLYRHWGLYSGSRLERYLRRLGYETPGQMMDIVLRAYSAHLNGKEVAEPPYQAIQHDNFPPLPPPPPPPGPTYSLTRWWSGPPSSRSHRRFLRTGRITDFAVIPRDQL